MRVAFLISEIVPDYGWARYAMDLATALAGHGIEVVALTQQKPRPMPDSVQLADSRPVLPNLVPSQGGLMKNSVLALPRVRRAAADCDIIHVIAEPYSILGAVVAGNRPLVVTAHGTYVPQTSQRRFVGRLYRWAYGRAHLIAVSDYTAGRVHAVLPDATVSVIRNGVHVAYFQQPAPEPDKRGPTILATGGIKQRKGTHLLIEAFAKVRKKVPDAQLVVTGRQDDIHYLSMVERQIEDAELRDCVHLVGMISDDELRGWYQHADVFALPSLNVGKRFEGFGLVFLEASAAGLPVVGTTGSGVAEAVIDGETGLLVPQHDGDALANAIVRVLNDDALRTRLSAGGRAHAESQDWTAIAGRVAALYQQILAR